MLAHAAECNDCSLHLREAAAIFGDDTAEVVSAMSSLASGTPEWRSRTAAMLSRESRPKPASWTMRRLLSVAAALVAVAGGALYFYWRAAQPPFDKLAAAYSLHRDIELRVPGAPYGPMRVERGAVSNRPAELLESEAAIARRLQRDPQDAKWLHARGVSEILERRYSDAVDSLRLALNLTAARTKAAAAINLDLATAYYGRAETERRAIDYSAALNALGEAIQINPTPEAYFNRAVINEKLHYYEPALADWKRYLELDHSGAWAKEAQEHRDALLKKTAAIRMHDSTSVSPELLIFSPEPH
jgi:tetratricopeptide (TPR) repeat protein